MGPSPSGKAASPAVNTSRKVAHQPAHSPSRRRPVGAIVLAHPLTLSRMTRRLREDGRLRRPVGAGATAQLLEVERGQCSAAGNGRVDHPPKIPRNLPASIGTVGAPGGTLPPFPRIRSIPAYHGSIVPRVSVCAVPEPAATGRSFPDSRRALGFLDRHSPFLPVAHIYKEGKAWRAQVARAGVRQSKTFRTKSAAEQWATTLEADLLATHTGSIPKRTVTQALDRYETEVSAKKKGHAWERKRLAQFRREVWSAYLLTDLSARHLAEWRDHRLQHITSGAVRRDLTLLRHVMSTARKEWGWLAVSPFDKLTMPQDNKARTRRIEAHEVKTMCRALGYVTGKVESKSQQVALAFLIALRTAMRAGEILSLTPADVDLSARVAHLSDSKNGDARDVPLSRAAVRLLRAWSGWTVTNASRDALFRKARVSAGLEGFHFHDARAEALTRLSAKLDPFELARMSGHRDMDLLLKRYYRKTASQIALKL